MLEFENYTPYTQRVKGALTRRNITLEAYREEWVRWMIARDFSNEEIREGLQDVIAHWKK